MECGRSRTSWTGSVAPADVRSRRGTTPCSPATKPMMRCRSGARYASGWGSWWSACTPGDATLTRFERPLMRATDRRVAKACVAIAMLAVPLPASAQLRASENFALTQVIDRDTIAITGSRPSMRGRTMYGDQLPWGKSWTPGANYATVLRVDRDFSINGTPVPKGSYSIWLVPRANDQWSMFLHPQARLFHTAHPDSTSSPYNFKLTARTIDPVETLTWSINDIRGWRSRVSMAF